MRFEVVRDIQTVRLQTFRPQTSDGPFGPAVGGLLNKAAASFDKTIQPRPWREGKHANQAAPDGNAPLLPTAPPPEGEVSSPLNVCPP